MSEIIVNVEFANSVPSELSIIRENYEKVIEIKRIRMIKINHKLNVFEHNSVIVDNVRKMFLSHAKELEIDRLIETINAEIATNKGIPEVKVIIIWKNKTRSNNKWQTKI